MDSNSNSNSNSNYSLGNSCPFDLSSFKKQSDHNPMNCFEVSGIYDSNILEEDNNIFLNNATISLNTKYNKNREKADVNYMWAGSTNQKIWRKVDGQWKADPPMYATLNDRRSRNESSNCES